MEARYREIDTENGRFIVIDREKGRTFCIEEIAKEKFESEEELLPPSLRKLEVIDGRLNMELESEQIVRLYVEHMKQLFDSVDGADNYLTIEMKFGGSDKFYTLTFQKHPGKTPAQLHQEEVSGLKATISRLQTLKNS